jgi:hypothetical protein
MNGCLVESLEDGLILPALGGEAETLHILDADLSGRRLGLQDQHRLRNELGTYHARVGAGSLLQPLLAAPGDDDAVSESVESFRQPPPVIRIVLPVVFITSWIPFKLSPTLGYRTAMR